MRITTFLRACVALFLAAVSSFGQSAADSAAKSKNLLVAVASEPNSLDPQLTISVNEFIIVSTLNEGLVTRDPATGGPAPGLAKSWEVKPDGRTHIFHLRPEAKWSNGESITANDFVQSYLRLLSPKLASDRVDNLFILKGAQAYYEGRTKDPASVGVRAIDAHTLELVTETPTLRLIPSLSSPFFYPVNTRVIDAHGAREDRMNRWTEPENYVSSGAFTFVRWSRDKELVVEKNPHYWDQANVQLESITFLPFSDRQAEERAFRAGQIHVSLAVPPNRIAFWKDNNPASFRVLPSYSIHFTRVNVTKAPLTDARIRRALSLAIDRATLAEKIVGPMATPAKRFIPYEKTPPPGAFPIEYNPDEARSLLKEAGFPSGEKFPMLTVLLNGNAVNQRVYEAIQQMWKRELGINVRLQSMEFNVLLETIKNRDFQLARSGLSGSVADPAMLFTTISRPNSTGWENAEFEKEWDAGASTADPAEADRHFHRAEYLLLESGSLIPLYHEDQAILLSKHVASFPLVLGGTQLLKNVRLAE